MAPKKGSKPWNKGLTAQTSDIIKKYSDKFKGFKHSDETKQKLRQQQLERLKTDPEYLKRLTEQGYKTASLHPEVGKSLGQWVKDNPGHSKQVIRETMKKYGNLHSKMGHSTHLKHPDHMLNTIKLWRKENPKLNREQAIKNGNNGIDLGKYAKEHREEYKKWGAASIEKQFSKGFVSEPEKIMRTLLPDDFVHNVRLGDYTPDFYSEKRKMIIEVDGIYWHHTPEQLQRDKLRDDYYLNKYNVRTFRFVAEVIQFNLINIQERIKQLFSS